MDTKEIMRLSVQKSYGNIFPLTVIVLAAAIFFIAFFIKKLKCSFSYVAKLAGFTLLATVFAELFIFLVGSWAGLFTVVCKNGLVCPSEFKIFFITIPYTAIPIFIFLTLFCYFVKFFSSQEKGVGHDLTG